MDDSGHLKGQERTHTLSVVKEPQFHSQILMVQPPTEIRGNSLGADVISKPQSLQEILGYSSHNVYVIFEPLAQLSSLLRAVRSHRPSAKILTVVTSQSPDWDQIFSDFNDGLIDQVIDYQDSHQLYQTVQELIQEVLEKEQKAMLIKLYDQQVHSLKQDQQLLTEAIKKRELFLRKSKDKADQQVKKTRILNQIILSLFQAQSVSEIEQSLLQSLSKTMPVLWVKLISKDKSNFYHAKQHLEEQIYSVEIPFQDRLSSYEVSIAKSDKFDNFEKNIIDQTAEAISLTLQRLWTQEQVKSLQNQWETTFNSLQSPLAIVNESLEVLSSNNSFKQLFGLNSLSLDWKNICELIRNKTSAEYKIQLGTIDRVFKIFRSPINSKKNKPTTRFSILLTDITHKKKIEEQILASSKMAELGVIGSSIAHELNNPLGGMLNFIELIQMDLSAEDPMHKEVELMRTSALKCKKIVENLLGFSRKEFSEKKDLSIETIFEKSQNLFKNDNSIVFQLKTAQLNPSKIFISANLDELMSALQQVIQNAIESYPQQTLPQDKRVHVEFKVTPSHLVVSIEDKGQGIPPGEVSRVFNPLFTTKGQEGRVGLGLTNTYKTVSEHLGRIEIDSSLSLGTRVIISLPRLDFPDQSQVLDRKI